MVRCRLVGIVLAHVLTFALVYHLSFYVRFEGSIPPEWRTVARQTMPVVIVVQLAAFLLTGSHRGWWRYATFADVVALAEAATLGTAVLVIISLVDAARFQIPRSVLLMDWAGTTLVICGIRASSRLFRERYHPMITRQPPRRVLIVGAAAAGEALVRSLHSQPHLGLRVVGFLDPDVSTHGWTLGGVKVLGSPRDLSWHVARQRVESVLIPTPALNPRDVRDLVTTCTELGVKVQVLPGLDALLAGSLTVHPRDVDIHDLLCRDPVRLDGESIGRFLRDRVVLVTGAAGSIGSEICRQVLSFQPLRLILLDHAENGLFFLDRELKGRAEGTEVIPWVASIADPARMAATFARFRPAVVFHAAAHKHVPLMEANPGEAVKNNIFGTRIVVDESIRSGVESFVIISTDKAVNPTSVMGACKRLAEMYVQALSGRSPTRLITVRFGNVLGSNGSVVPIFREQICNGGPVTVTHPEMTRFFMTIPEAAQLVLQAGALGRGGEIFVLDMGEPVKIVDLARDMIRLSGLKEGEGIEIAYTGLRPGEKLFEELYDPDEERLHTPHPKIFRAKHRPCSLNRLRVALDELAHTVERPADEVIAVLSQIIPEYRPRFNARLEPAAAGALAGTATGDSVDTALALVPRPAISSDALAMGS
jgi:FlaA1/EpsC-like NDP-sugar epimerase